MKKKLLLITIFSLLVFVTAFSQQMNHTAQEGASANKVMIGPYSLNELKHSVFAPWFKNQYKNYKPDKKVVKKIKKKLDKTEITIVFGSWCGDSKKQVGRFYKILNKAGFNTDNAHLIAVNHQKKAPGTDISGLHIKKIPDFIVYYHGKELGRIVESPKTTLEKDLKDILEDATVQ